MYSMSCGTCKKSFAPANSKDRGYCKCLVLERTSGEASVINQEDIKITGNLHKLILSQQFDTFNDIITQKNSGEFIIDAVFLKRIFFRPIVRLKSFLSIGIFFPSIRQFQFFPLMTIRNGLNLSRSICKKTCFPLLMEIPYSPESPPATMATFNIRNIFRWTKIVHFCSSLRKI